MFPQREYSGLIFDCDGTLTDSMPVHFVAWQRTMNRYGISFPEEQFYSLGGMPSFKIIEKMAFEQKVAVDSHLAAKEKEDAFLEFIHFLRPIEPVVEVARAFRGQLPMAVASGGYRDVILMQLKQIGCEGWFDAIVTAEDTINHKPAPDVFLKAAELMNVPSSRCLVYEDSDLGLLAAEAAGMDAIDVRTFHKPQRIFVD